MAAKSARDKIRLVSSAGTGHFYTTSKNKRNMPEKMEIKKFDPVIFSIAACRSCPGSCSSRVTRSASSTGTPRLANSPATRLLPQPIPPVSPTRRMN